MSREEQASLAGSLIPRLVRLREAVEDGETLLALGIAQDLEGDLRQLKLPEVSAEEPDRS